MSLHVCVCETGQITFYVDEDDSVMQFQDGRWLSSSKRAALKENFVQSGMIRLSSEVPVTHDKIETKTFTVHNFTTDNFSILLSRA